MPAKTKWKRLALMVSPVDETVGTAVPAAGNGATRLASGSSAKTCDSRIDLTICSACATEQYVAFSPAFVFGNLARGPPKRA